MQPQIPTPPKKANSGCLVKILGVVALLVLILVLIPKTPQSQQTPATEPVKSSETDTSATDAQNLATVDKAIHDQLLKDINAHEGHTYSPDQLVEAYDENVVRADKKFKGEKIYVEGEIESIDKDVLGKPFALFKSKDGVRSVQAYLFNDNAAAALNKGQKVTLSGTCRGFVIANVVLTDAGETSSLSRLKERLNGH